MSKKTPTEGRMKIKRSLGERIFDAANCVFLGLLCFTFIYPFWYLFAVSIADAGKQAMSRIYFLPTYFSLDSYKNVLSSIYVWYGFLWSILRTVLGTIIALIVGYHYAYCLSKRYLPNRGFWTTILIITMFFSGGLVPEYLLVKDLGLREPYIGQCELVSGEMAIDFANYFTVSEQQPSLVALGVLVAGDTVLKAGGLLIQPLPGCPDEVIDQIELRSPMFSDISREMTFAPKEELLEDWFRGMDLQILERAPLRYHCACSRYRMEKALISLGRRELNTLIEEDTGAELGCHFCHSQYAFSTDDLKELLERATRD